MQHLENRANGPEVVTVGIYRAAVGRRWDEHYRAAFERLLDGHPAARFQLHVPAFVFGAWWFIYRKIWLYFLLDGLLIGIAAEIIYPWVGLQWALGFVVIERLSFSLLANGLYFREISGAIEELRTKGLTEAELAAELKRRFGTLL